MMDELSVGQLTNKIARAKAMAKVRGPFRVACSACGKYYWPDRREEHLRVCKPPKVHINPPKRKRSGPRRISPRRAKKLKLLAKQDRRAKQQAADAAARARLIVKSTDGPRPSDKEFLRMGGRTKKRKG